jgi:hypothetical protein
MTRTIRELLRRRDDDDPAIVRVILRFRQVKDAPEMTLVYAFGNHHTLGM